MFIRRCCNINMRIVIHASLCIAVCGRTNSDLADVLGGGFSTNATSSSDIVTVGMNASQASFAFAYFLDTLATNLNVTSGTILASFVKKIREPLDELIRGLGSSSSSDSSSTVAREFVDFDTAASVFPGGISLNGITLNAAIEAVRADGSLSMDDIQVSEIVADVVQTIKSKIVSNNLSLEDRNAPLSLVYEPHLPETFASPSDDSLITANRTVYTQMCVDSKSALQNAFTKYMRFAKISDQAVVRQYSASIELTSYVYRCAWRNDAWFYGQYMRVALGPLFELQSAVDEACSPGGTQDSVPTVTEMIKMKATQFMVRLMSALVDMTYTNYVGTPTWFCPIAWYDDMYNQPDARACFDFGRQIWYFINPPGAIETQKRFYRIYSDIQLDTSPLSTDLSNGGFSTSETDLKNLHASYTDQFEVCENVANKYTNIMASFQYNNYWYLSDLTNDEISYYKLMSICRVDDQPILDTAASIAQIQANAASSFTAYSSDVSGPVFSCVNNMINTVTKNRVNNRAETHFNAMPPRLSACDELISTYNIANFSSDYARMRLVRIVKQLYASIISANAEVSAFFMSTYCPLLSYTGSATFAVKKSQAIAGMTSWTSSNGALYKLQAVADQIKSTYDTLSALSASDLNQVDIQASFNPYQRAIKSSYASLREGLTEYIVFVSAFRPQIIDQLHYDINDGSFETSVNRMAPGVRESIPPVTCTVGETNALVYTQGLAALVSTCVVPGKQVDRQNLQSCIRTNTPGLLGVSTMTSDCFTCLLDAVDLINKVSSAPIRSACIANLRDSACTVDFTNFVACSGYKLQDPIVRSYCSADQNLQAINSSLYRDAVTLCVKSDGSGTSDIDSCVSSLAVGIDADCLGCWTDFIHKIAGIPQSDRDGCLADPVGDSCLSALKSDYLGFVACTGGLDPMYLDLESISSKEANTSAISVVISSLWLVALITLLN